MNLPELPFALDPHGPDGGWVYENGVLTGRAGARQDRFVPPGGRPRGPARAPPRRGGGAPAGGHARRHGGPPHRQSAGRG
ncbi:hypothetical protein ACFWNC_35330, partial [Streptomyces sp. NPDC058369]